MTRVFIGLGSNRGDVHRQLDQALTALAELPRSELIRCSPRYWTTPMGDPDQPEFLNAVAEMDTALEPLELLRQMQSVENDLGRVRDSDRRWGPRTIDLDLLLFGETVITNADLVVPHPRMAGRAFVLKPLADLVPGLKIPGLARISDLLGELDAGGVRCATPDVSDNGA